MDLMLEEVRQYGGNGAGRRFAIGPRQHDLAGKAFVRLPLAKIDKALVVRGLHRPQKLRRREIRIGFAVAPERILTVDRIDVVLVDPQDMVERGADRREETRSRGRELFLAQGLAGLEQTMIGPSVVVRLT